jgi:hypothetical protein
MTIEQARAKRWTPEARAKQAAAIKQWQPWKQSTGAKTVQGQANSAANNRYRCVHQSGVPIRVLLDNIARECKANGWFKK